MTPRGKINRAAVFATLIETTPGLRLEEHFGTPYKTGQTLEKIQFVIDIELLLIRHCDHIRKRHGERRAERFRDWAFGRPWSTFWIHHRKHLMKDREDFLTLLQDGHYRCNK